MARTADQIRADIDAVRSAIGSGVLSVSYTDRSVTYRSISELRAALNMLEAELSALLGSVRVRSVTFMTGKGL